MGKRNKFTAAILTIAQLFVLAIVISLSHSGGRAGATGSIDITGTVANQNGSGVANVSVYATNPGGSTVEFGPTTTASDGTYDLQVVAGTYDFHFDPATGSGLASTVESNITVLNDQTVDVQLAPPTYTFSGTLTDSAGNPLPGVHVVLSASPFSGFPGSGQSITDGSGNFSVSAVAGQYYLTVVNEGGSGVDNIEEFAFG